MKALKLAISVLLLLVVLAYTLAFAAHNSADVTVNFLAGATLTLPLAIWIGLFISVGALTAWLVGGLTSTVRQLKLRKLQKELKQARQRLDKVS